MRNAQLAASLIAGLTAVGCSTVIPDGTSSEDAVGVRMTVTETGRHLVYVTSETGRQLLKVEADSTNQEQVAADEFKIICRGHVAVSVAGWSGTTDACDFVVSRSGVQDVSLAASKFVID